MSEQPKIEDQDDKQPELTPEELAELKKEAFLKEPDRFIDKQFIVAAAVLDPKTMTVMTMVNPSVPGVDLAVAQQDLNFFITRECTRRYIAKVKKADKFKLIKPGGNGGAFGKKKRF